MCAKIGKEGGGRTRVKTSRLSECVCVQYEGMHVDTQRKYGSQRCPREAPWRKRKAISISKNDKLERREHTVCLFKVRVPFSTLPGCACCYDGYQFHCKFFLFFFGLPPEMSARFLGTDKQSSTSSQKKNNRDSKTADPDWRLFIIQTTLTGAVMMCGEELHSF